MVYNLKSLIVLISLDIHAILYSLSIALLYLNSNRLTHVDYSVMPKEAVDDALS